MLELKAPWPAPVVTTYLPNPKLGDSESLTSTVAPKRAMDGTLYTYVKTSNGRRKLTLQFIMTRLKGEEFKRFLLLYASYQIRMVDHLSRVWVGYFVGNPIEFSTPRRGHPGGGGELMEVEIDFEGFIQ